MFMNNPYRNSQPEVVSGAYGDVNGDGMADYVFLSAIKSADLSSPYVEQITLNIQDGATNFVQAISLETNAGYQPSLYLGDFTGDGIMDILISIDSGGSGALTYDYVYSYVNNQAVKLFDYNDYNRQNQYTVTYLDQYKVSIQSPATGQTYLVDISGRSPDYLSQIYHVDGTLKKPIQGMDDGVSGFYPVDMDRNGVYEIQAFQLISGRYHADGLGYIINTLQWNGRKFVIWQQWLAILGN
ncbi:FG-GAP-like repeat-containing protein [Virgibacillus sp. W0181]|uniref:FG-GAP-like repeat-containing protein n=1 Tax=Virgibacillus sp. W0181 TaxID=3391581 RepID=UPI003F46C9D4